MLNRVSIEKYEVQTDNIPKMTSYSQRDISQSTFYQFCRSKVFHQYNTNSAF